MSGPKSPRPQDFIDQFNDNLKSTLGGTIGMRLLECGAGSATAELAFSSAIRQVTGLVHAGALITLADTVATAACLSLLSPPEGISLRRFPLTIQISSNLIANVSSGKVIASARTVHAGRSTIVMETRIASDAGKLLAVVTTTHFVVQR